MLRKFRLAAKKSLLLPRKPVSMDHLLFIPEDEWVYPEDESYSGSDLSDPFYSYHSAYMHRILEDRRKRFTRTEIIRRLMDSFSGEFKAAMDEVKNEAPEDRELYVEDLDSLAEKSKSADNDSRLSAYRRRIPKKLFDCGISQDSSSFSVDSTSTAFDRMSGMWRMLAATDSYLVTPAGFDIYSQLLPHWMERVEVPWETVNKSCAKCEEWLEKNFHPKGRDIN